MTTGTPPLSPMRPRAQSPGLDAVRELDDDDEGIQRRESTHRTSERPTTRDEGIIDRTASMPAPWSPGKAMTGGNNVAGWLRSRLGMEPNDTQAHPSSNAHAWTNRGASTEIPAPSPALTNVTSMLGDVMLQADNEQLFRHGLFNAVGNAILLCTLGLVYSTLLLLEQFRSPILWALLVSLALRDVKTATVSFLTATLKTHTLLSLAAAPFAKVASLAVSLLRGFERATSACARGDLTAVFNRGGGLDLTPPGSPKRTPPVSPIRRALTSPLARTIGVGADSPRSPGARLRALRAAFVEPNSNGSPPCSKGVQNANSISASNFHFRWLLCVGVAAEIWNVVARDWALTRSIVALGLVAVCGCVATVGLLTAAHWYTFARPGAYAFGKMPLTFGDAYAKSVGALGLFTVNARWANTRWANRVTKAYTRCDLAIREGLIASLHFVVAVGLITGGIVLVVCVAAFFTVNIAQESSGAVAMLAQTGKSIHGSSGPLGSMMDSPMMDSLYSVYGEAVEKHLPSAVEYLTSHVEDVFPGANATELWESMQHIYAQLGSESSVNGVKTDVWATSVKEAGSKLGSGNVSGAFAVLKSFGDEILNVEKVSGGSRGSSASSANIIPGMDNLVRVMNAIVEALRARTSGILAHGGRGAAAVTAWALRASFSVFAAAGGVVNFILKAVVFLTVLFHILNSELDPAVRLVELIPVNDRVKDVAVHSLTRGVRGVFVSCAKLALFHAAFTWVTFRAFGVHFVYTSTLASGATAILPLLASWSVSVPAALGLLAKGQGLKGALLVVSHWVTLIFVDIDIYQSEIQVVHPYIVGLSVVGGMSVWDSSLEGAVLGPLLVTALATARNVYRELVRTPPAGGVAGGAGVGGATPGRTTATARRRANGGNGVRGWTPGRT